MNFTSGDRGKNCPKTKNREDNKGDFKELPPFENKLHLRILLIVKRIFFHVIIKYLKNMCLGICVYQIYDEIFS